MNSELEIVLSNNTRYKEAYYEFIEMHKNGHGKNDTPEQLAEFEKWYAKDFLSGIKNDSDERVELIKGERIVIRKANIADADFMSDVERDSDNSPWVANWPLGWRIAKFGDKDFLQTILEKEDGTPIGFIIFRNMADVQTKLELKRIAIIEKGKGYGKEALLLAQKLAFDVFGTKYLYLGTREANVRAQNIYKTTGFIPDMPDPCTKFHITEKDYRK
ncbi:MAG: GNAT family N-acetyltransferase [Lachnospiraceae bacterium]|nr:GNAT family N-acetyltransferase [Lachnospiraceae bacterium]